MRVNRTILAITVLSSLLIGCSRDEGPDSVASTTRPTAGQDAPSGAMGSGAMAAAAVEPAGSQPTASALFVDQHEEWFPPAMLRLRQRGGQVVARLYSDDPEDVLTGKQTCNSYDFQMPLPQIAQVSDLPRAVWIARAKSSDRVDTPYGIFLRNGQEVLQPMDATIRFRGNAPQVSVFIDGTFWLFHTNDDSSGAPPAMVRVKGALLATVPAK